MSRLGLYLAFIIGCIFGASALYGEYPSKPITIIVHSKPGSGIDITSRQLAHIARKYTDAVILVENKSGGSGIVAMRTVLNKKSDGYTVLAVTKSFISTVLLTKSGIGMDDFDFLACMVVDPEVLITNRHSSVRTLEDIIRDAREKNGRQRWLGPLVGGVDHLMAVKTWEKLGIKGEWIPYEGGADALAALMGKHGVVYVGNPVDVKGRPDLMIAAVAAPQRLPDFPDAPTFTEKGYDLENEVLWRGFAVKKGTDPRAVQFLMDLFRKVSQDPDWLKFINSTSAQPVFLPREQFTRMVQRDQQEARKYLKLAGIGSVAADANPVANYRVPLFLALLYLILIFSVYRLKPHWITGDNVIAATLIFISGYLYYLTLNFPVGKLSRTVGPASMPRLWIYALYFFCGWLIYNNLRKGKAEDNSNHGSIRKPLALVFLMVGYLLFINYAGYFVSTFLFLLAGTYLMSYRRHLVAISVIIGFLLLSYLAFYKVLQVPLPLGVWFE